MTKTSLEIMPNQDYLELLVVDRRYPDSAISLERDDRFYRDDTNLSKTKKLPKLALLPHESDLIGRANKYYSDSKNPRHVSDLLIPFLENPEKYFRDPGLIENEYTKLRVSEVAPYIGAMVVDYPTSDQTRATLGSRVTVAEDDEMMIVDLVGHSKLYKNDIVDPDGGEVLPITISSPLAAAIIGEKVNATKELESGLKITILDIDQNSIRQQWLANIVNLKLVD